jgi:hypothetical protein
MRECWEKPVFQEISVNGECTAYSGQGTGLGQTSAPADTAAGGPALRAAAAVDSDRTPDRAEVLR